MSFNRRSLHCLPLAVLINLTVITAEFFKPFNVSYDSRAFIIDGHRRMLMSGSVHYPRATPEMWPDLIFKSKLGGLDVIETYVFWNWHEPVRRQYRFEGRYDVVKFVKLVGLSGLYLHLRIGPYVCAEWNFGGFPVWLRDVPGIKFRTDNAPFKEEMQRFVKKIVDLMREAKLFSWQGGPIILLQIENEYGNVESKYGQKGKSYVKWAAGMAIGLDARVPWVMCKQTDAPDAIIDSCNGYYCDGFKPNSINKPKIWTENWDGGYTQWGRAIPTRPVEDIAFSVARFYQRGGCFMNYYMYFGGTNFERTSGGPSLITSYDYDAPIDEYGLLRQPKWGHLKDLHAALKLCEPALVAVDSPLHIKFGQNQEAHVYSDVAQTVDFKSSDSILGSRCAAFLSNIDQNKAAAVRFGGQLYNLPPWSVSILPDCQNTVFNTAQIGAQTTIKTVEFDLPPLPNFSESQGLIIEKGSSNILRAWKTLNEPIGIWSATNFTARGILEHLNVTKDQSDYLWHFTRIYVSDADIAFWENQKISPALVIDSMRDVLRVFINGQLTGSVVGQWVKVVLSVQFAPGYNDFILLSETVGLQNYGAFLERDGAGFKGQIKLTGFKDGDVDLSKLLWNYQVGLMGESLKLYTREQTDKAEWTDLTVDALPSTFTWYKTYFDAPSGEDPVSIDLGSMGKGEAWVNGYLLGRYWILNAPNYGCPETCDYRGAFNSDKCLTNCGQPSQSRYHVPKSWLKDSNNLLVIFEETGGNPFEISIKRHANQAICAQLSESHYPPLQKWIHLDSAGGKDSLNEEAPEMHLYCDDGYKIFSIDFASYGTPKGGCSNFSHGICHAANSSSVVSEACLGQVSCQVGVSSAVFGDPCPQLLKTLAVRARCGRSSDFQLS